MWGCKGSVELASLCSPMVFITSICTSNDDFVLCLQAKRAVQRGATAVIFDVSENPDAIDQVCTHLKLLGHSCTHVSTVLRHHNLSRSVCITKKKEDE